MCIYLFFHAEREEDGLGFQNQVPLFGGIPFDKI